MIASFLGPGAAARLREDDPLPPDDRVIRQRSGLDTLYRTHGPRLLRFFSRRADHHEASDLMHESFLRYAAVEAKRDEDVVCPEAYLNQIATNLVRDRAKAALRRSLAPHVPGDDAMPQAVDLVARLEARDKLDRLNRALMRLKPKTREIFLAHRLEGMSYREIAGRFGLSVKGVEWHMTKAIDHLDRALRR